MGFLEKMGAAVGIGIAKLSVTLDEPAKEYAGGDVIRGTITLNGGSVDEVGRLTVAIVERWETYTYTGTAPVAVPEYLSHNETIVVEALELKAQEPSEEFRFALTMVPDADLSHTWSVGALYESDEAVDSVGAADFKVCTPSAIVGLQAAVPAVMGFELYNLYNNGTEYHLDFRAATPEVKNKFDSIHLTVHLNRDADTLNGTLLVNPQEHTLRDHIQSLTQSNNRSYPIEMTASEAAKGAEGNVPGIVRAILEADPAGAPRA